MIGGRVLDASAVSAFMMQRSVFASALVWTATDEDVVLLVPASALAVASGEGRAGDAVLDVLLGLPITVVDVLDGRRARRVGETALERGAGDDVVAAHAALCATERGWSLVTAEPARYATFGDHIELDELP